MEDEVAKTLTSSLSLSSLLTFNFQRDLSRMARGESTRKRTTSVSYKEGEEEEDEQEVTSTTRSGRKTIKRKPQAAQDYSDDAEEDKYIEGESTPTPTVRRRVDCIGCNLETTPKKKRKSGSGGKKVGGRKGKLSKMNDLPLDIWLSSEFPFSPPLGGLSGKLNQFLEMCIQSQRTWILSLYSISLAQTKRSIKSSLRRALDLSGQPSSTPHIFPNSNTRKTSAIWLSLVSSTKRTVISVGKRGRSWSIIVSRLGGVL